MSALVCASGIRLEAQAAMKKVVIICDRCNKQYFNKIPKTCRVCGEELYWRMPPEYRILIKERIEALKQPYSRNLVLSYIIFGTLFIVATILYAQDLEKPVNAALPIIGVFYVLASPFFLPAAVSGHPLIHLFVFLILVIITGIFSTEFTGQSYEYHFLDYNAHVFGVLFATISIGFIINLIYKLIRDIVVGNIILSDHPAAVRRRRRKGKILSRRVVRKLLHVRKMKMFTLIPNARPLFEAQSGNHGYGTPVLGRTRLHG